MRVPPVGVAGAAALAQIWLSRRASGSTASRMVAGGVAALSAGVLLASVGSFRRHDTSVNPLEVDRAATLVHTGIFRVSRNPMYVGMAGLLVAQAIQRRSWVSMLPAALFVAVMQRVQIPVEERFLRERFGPDFELYLREVPRWVDHRSVGSRLGR
ncbi:isoprenylcysteine carboxylmethyltransferase family protein [Mycolicibacterium neoaurum]|uniref:methyltransferase family protein n=1 Tax=Mycolicibacterium neoaurum TaxID=1795 RepID=UPI00248B9CAF|nr:isoprenylcysteine carboxylmethyltransferase family protein [Mycolicibacterium neoaurum]MDO3403079.1 isoprenylcysteine carboxylmethyltransferase family protein [Mycolicibacterium neoaurum]WBP94853.1 isoprenylcysteine carboxylmethyltransferase family protein [Mycolicibacterium neoaurum]WBS08848.1 isoprenylcysteine carboxylmethyltransferase family protein [Mycolicibacterium neoaurum]